MHPVPSMHAGTRFAGPYTKQMLEGSPLVDLHFPFSVPTAPPCSCVLVLEAPLSGKSTKGKACSSSHGTCPFSEPGKEGTPGAAPLQAEATAHIAGCAEGGRQVWAPLASLRTRV